MIKLLLIFSLATCLFLNQVYGQKTINNDLNKNNSTQKKIKNSNFQNQNQDQHQFRFGFGINLAPEYRRKLTSSDAVIELGGSETRFQVDSYKSYEAGVSFDVEYTKSNSFGLSASLIYFFPNKVDVYTPFAEKSALSSTIAGYSEFQNTFLEINGLYKIDHFYIPVGLNYSFNSLTSTYYSGVYPRYLVTPQIGYQLGVGYDFNNFFRLEGKYRIAKFSFEGKEATTPYKVTISNATLESLEIIFKFMWQ